MHFKKLYAAVFTAVWVAPAMAGYGLQNFYVADAVGNFYTVNGDTLNASYIQTFENAPLLNEILYLGDDRMLINSHGQLVEYDLSTHDEEVVFNATDYFGFGDYHLTSGLAMTSSGDVFFSYNNLSQNNYPGTYGALFNPDAHEFTLLDAFDPGIPGVFYDFHELSDGIYLGANYLNQDIELVDMNVNDITQIFDTGIENVSFFQQGETLITMTIDGDLYRFDPMSGDTDYIGKIQGTMGSLAGATVPAPSGVALIGMVGIVSARRRR